MKLNNSSGSVLVPENGKTRTCGTSLSAFPASRATEVIALQVTIGGYDNITIQLKLRLFLQEFINNFVVTEYNKMSEWEKRQTFQTINWYKTLSFPPVAREEM